MFQRGVGGPPPLMQPPSMQPQPPGLPELTAKERLTSYIYEYLLQSGATKTAETFKEEVINAHPALANNSIKPSEKSFLLDWWILFWDLWAAAPERRGDPLTGDHYTQEAKYFHETMIGMPPGMNGHFPPPPMGIEMMGGHPGAFGARFPPGRMPPAGMPHGGFPMFNPDPRLQMRPNPGLRMPPPGPFPGPGGMPRPGVPGAPMDMGGMPRYDFMGPAGAQPFPGASGSGMMPNGAMPHMSLNSPSMVPSQVGDPNMPPAFMGMPPMPPTSSSAMPFGMTDQPMSAGPNGGAPGPGTPGMGGSIPGAGPGSVPPVATTSVGSVGTPSSMNQSQQQPKQEITANNCDEMKTEALTPTGAASGSVGALSAGAVAAVSMNGGGPGSAPGSAHSVNNNVNPSTPSGGPMSNPLSNPMSNPPLSSGPPPGSTDAFKDDSEISKIREGLLEGFKTEVAGWE